MPDSRSTKPEGSPSGRTVPVGLTPELIVSATIALLDERGHEWLTMRRLADHLQVSVATIYWHMGSRQGLMDASIDTALDAGDMTVAEGPDWHPCIEQYMRELRRRLTAHPWLTELARHRYTPSHQQLMVHALGAAATMGLPDPDTTGVARLMIWQVTGFAVMENSIRLDSPFHQPSSEGDSSYTITAPNSSDVPSDPRLLNPQLSTLDIDGLFDLHVQVFIDGLEKRLGAAHTS